MDNRSPERKQRAIKESRKAFDDFSASEAAENIINKAGLSI